MKFYRLAERIDFQKAEKLFEQLPREAKDIIRLEGNVPKARLVLTKNHFYSSQEAKEVCEAYWALLKARNDFFKGVKVYTEY